MVILMIVRYIVGKITYHFALDFQHGEYRSPIVIMMAVAVFALFQKMTIAPNKIISFFSSSAVSVYLITEYPAVREFLINNFRNMYELVCTDAFFGLLYVFVYATALFVICTIIDKIRILIQTKIESLIYKE